MWELIERENTRVWCRRCAVYEKKQVVTEASSKTSHKAYCDEETSSATDKKQHHVREPGVVEHSSELEVAAVR